VQQLHENWFDVRPGKNFCDNTSNKTLLAPWCYWLLSHMGTHPASIALTKDAHTHSGAPQWDTYGMRHYLECVTALLHKLIVLIHMTSGLPARGSELLVVRWCNTKKLRNVLICEGYVHKRKWQVGARAVTCFLLLSVGHLLVQVIVLILTFACILRQVLHTLPQSTNDADDTNLDNDNNMDNSTNIDVNEKVVGGRSGTCASVSLPVLAPRGGARLSLANRATCLMMMMASMTIMTKLMMRTMTLDIKSSWLQ
jgi:hypothetical protein